MSDAHIQGLERRYRETGDASDHVALLRSKLRAGLLTVERVAAAAALGCPGAKLLGVAPAKLPPPLHLQSASEPTSREELRFGPPECELSVASGRLEHYEAIGWAFDCAQEALRRNRRVPGPGLWRWLRRDGPERAWVPEAEGVLALVREVVRRRGQGDTLPLDRAGEALFRAHLEPKLRSSDAMAEVSTKALQACIEVAGLFTRPPIVVISVPRRAGQAGVDYTWLRDRLVEWLLGEAE